MATIIGILDAVFTELVAVAGNDIGVATPKDHVDIMDRSEDLVTPFLGFSWDRTPVDYGFGGNSRTTAINTDNNGDITSVDKVTDFNLVVDIGVVVDGDNPRLRDQYLTYVESHFDQFIDHPTNFHADADTFRAAGMFPQEMGAGSDVGGRVSYEIRYRRLRTESVPSADTVNWNVDVSGVDAYPENYG